MTKSNYPDSLERRALILAADATAQSPLLPREGPPRDDRRSRLDGLNLDDVLIVGMHNVPSAEELETVKAAFPEAAPTLDRWLENWTRMLEDNPSAKRVVSSIAGGRGNYKTEIQWNTNRHKLFSDLLNGEHPGRYGLRRLMNADYYERHLRGRQRNFLHHYVDDAFSFLSFASAQPGLAVLWTSVDDLMLMYTGEDADGMLTFDHLSPNERSVISKLRSEKHEDDGKYWNWKPIADGMRRESCEALDHIDAAEILLDMAQRGHARAFVKAIKSKCGTWTVDLSGVKTSQDALRHLIRDGFDSSDSFRHGLVVQEHLPTTREQRFFVTNGRIVASVCSDRNLNGTFRREGRFFDERVAVIERPEVTGGEFERGQTSHEVNRPLAAAFARAARQIVREMRGEGRLHYVVDMGLTERGVVAIEINSFFRSGPYCLDRRRVTSAHRRALTETQRGRATANLKVSFERKAEAAARVVERNRREREDWSTAPDFSFDFDANYGVIEMPAEEVPSLITPFEAAAAQIAANADVLEAMETLPWHSDTTSVLADRIADNDRVLKTLYSLDFNPRNPHPPVPVPVSSPRLGRRRGPSQGGTDLEHEG